MRPRLLACFVLAVAGVAPTILVPRPAVAQSDADKATARKLAQDAIAAFKAGRFSEALDKALRAQSLFDAPVHLLYIARAQVQLGQLVEGAETYRKLARVSLDANAPAAFKQAVAAAPTELGEFEAKIPSLRIEAKPSVPADLDLRIDGQKVSSALIGVDRPVNPGEHVVQAWAPGKKPVEVKLTVGLGQHAPVVLEFVAGEGAPPPPLGNDTGSAPILIKPGEGPASGSGPSSGTSNSGLGWYGGLRLMGVVPGGSLEKNVPTKDAVGPGVALELRGGARFLKHFGAGLFLEAGTLKPKQDSELFQAQQQGTAVETSAVMVTIGAEVLYLPERGKFGPFVGLGLGYQLWSATITGSGNSSCSGDRSYSGAVGRLSGGLQIPVGDTLQLSPTLGYSFGTFTTFESSGSCGGQVEFGTARSIDSEGQALHTSLLLGVGGELWFGADKPRK
jgi:hypothetical protein